VFLSATVRFCGLAQMLKSRGCQYQCTGGGPAQNPGATKIEARLGSFSTASEIRI
jgi:hypothetical protein